jgi:hypothetical protein
MAACLGLARLVRNLIDGFEKGFASRAATVRGRYTNQGSIAHDRCRERADARSIALRAGSRQVVLQNFRGHRERVLAFDPARLIAPCLVLAKGGAEVFILRARTN